MRCRQRRQAAASDLDVLKIMIGRITLFLGLTTFLFALESFYHPRFLLEFSNTESVGFVMTLQITGSTIFILGIVAWAYLTREKRKKKSYKPLPKRLSGWIPVFLGLLLLGLLRNEYNAENWQEALKYESIKLGILAWSIFPVFIFYFIFYPELGGTKNSQNKSAHTTPAIAPR